MDSSFFGYKTHIAMSEERIITAATITTGEKNGGKQLENLITKSIEAEFEFNKDAGMYVCKAGHIVIKKARQGGKRVAVNQTDTYYFDISKCNHCLHKEGCYKEGSKSKSYSVSLKSEEHTEQAKFQESDYFKEKAKE